MVKPTTWLQTHSGRKLDFLAPHPSQIDLDDIIRSLAVTARFRGQSCLAYSVASHTLLVAELARKNYGDGYIPAALVHDMHEAYIGDIPSPLKALLGPELTSITSKLDAAIETRFGLVITDEMRKVVKELDILALRAEVAVLFEDAPTEDWPCLKEFPPSAYDRTAAYNLAMLSIEATYNILGKICCKHLIGAEHEASKAVH